MIEAKDLRIGNLYKGASRGNIETATGQTIAQIEEGKLNALPIELNPEILEAAGFRGLPHFTVQNSIQLSVGRDRFISIGDVGTPNEMVFLTEEEPPKVNSVIVLRNFDYDGKTYLHHLQNLYHSLTGSDLKIELPTTGKE